VWRGHAVWQLSHTRLDPAVGGVLAPAAAPRCAAELAGGRGLRLGRGKQGPYLGLQGGGEVDADVAELLLEAGDPVVRFTGDELLVQLQEQGVLARPDRMQSVRHLVYGGADPAPVILQGLSFRAGASAATNRYTPCEAMSRSPRALLWRMLKAPGLAPARARLLPLFLMRRGGAAWLAVRVLVSAVLAGEPVLIAGHILQVGGVGDQS
jgi:hypothetical protein